MVICRGCGEEKKLIKAHIIPETFFKGMRSGNGSPLLVTNHPGSFPKKSPIGVYDINILCKQCEDKFQKIDDYAQKLLLKDENTHKEIKISNSLYGYKIEKVNSYLLKLFFISMLWRASISSHSFYSKVSLGKFENEAKKLIWSNETGEIDDFSFVLAKFTDQTVGKAMLDPHRERWDGVNYCRFYMYGYVVYIKVDKRKTPKYFKPFIINDDGILHIVARDIYKSSELSLMGTIVNRLDK